MVFMLFCIDLDMEMQREDLVMDWDEKYEGEFRLDVLFYHENTKNMENESFKNLESLFETLSKLDETYQVHIYKDGVLKLLNKEKFKEKLLMDMMGVLYPMKNYMKFLIDKVIVPDSRIKLAFKSKLDKKGLAEKERLINYIKLVDNLTNTTQGHFYVPFINVCQSSGSGKSKVATELMKDFPAAYFALRDESDKLSYPGSSDLSRLFMLKVRNDFQEDYYRLGETASQSIVGRYLLLMKALLKDYIDAIKKMIKDGEIDPLRKMAKLFVDGEFMGKELEMIESSYLNWDIDAKYELKPSTGRLATVEKCINACKLHLCEISKLTVNKLKMPFTLIIDEASLCKTNHFRLFRRSVHLISDSNFVAITLDTNFDMIDLNPGSTINSFRETRDWKLFPLFTINRIWDISFDYEKFIKKPIGYYSTRCGKLLTFLFSLGRPVWSSVKLSDLVYFAGRKISNGCLESGEAYLAFWMVRTGLLTNPAHVINSFLVNSLMATVLFVSPNLDYIRVYYPSEPALAIAARKKLDAKSSLLKHYQMLEKYIQMRAVDQDKFSGIISMDITLRAISEAEPVSCDWNYENIDKLPNVCATKQFIFESRNDEQETEAGESDSHSKDPITPILPSENRLDSEGGTESKKPKLLVPSEKDLEEKITKPANTLSVASRSLIEKEKRDYRIVTVKSFLIKMYGKDAYKKMKRYIPKRIKSGLINTSHLSQFHRDIPENINTFKQGTTQNSTNTCPCDVLTHQALAAAAARGSGIIFPANYFGFDYAIPVILKPLTKKAVDEEEGTCEKSMHKQEEEHEVDETIQFKETGTSADVASTSLYDESDDDEKEAGSIPFIVKDADFEAIPEYTIIGIKVKRSSPGSIKKVVAKGAFSNHIVKCGIHSTPTCKCTFKLSTPYYKDILQNALMLVHSMSAENESFTAQNSAADTKSVDKQIDFDCEYACSDAVRDKICNNQYRLSKKEHMNLIVDSECRFKPDVYLSGKVNECIKLHIMLKSKSGFIEKLTAIHSTGLAVFMKDDFFPGNVLEIASRIIANDRSIFKEVSPLAANTYKELVNSIVARNNDGSYPLCSNLLRKLYKQEEVNPPQIKYATIDPSHMELFGRDPEEERKRKTKKY